MSILTYQLDVIGEAKISAALASVERRFVQHQARINRVLSMGGGTIRTRASAASGGGGVRTQLRETTAAQEKAVKLSREQLKSVRDIGIKERAAQRERLTGHRAELRAVERKKREELGAIRTARRERERERKSGSRAFRGAIGTGVTGSIGRLAAVGTAGAAMIGVGGSVLAAQAVNDTLKLDEQVRRLVVAGRGKGEAGQDPEALRRKIVSTGMNVGLAPEQVASGLGTFVARTGDLDTAVRSMDVFATVAQATGASMDDVAGSAADLMQKFDIKTVDGMADAFGVLVAQGKKGAFELKDMAANFPEMAAAAQRAGMKGIQGMKNLGGLAQIARTSTGSGAEASTAVQMMLTQLIADSGKLASGEALGGKKVNIFTGKDSRSPLRAIPEVLADVISKSGGDLQQLQKLFDVRGVRAVSPMISKFREVSAAAGGGKAGEEAGKAAVLAMIAEAAEVAGDYSEVQRDAADVQKSDSIKLQVALEELRQVFAEELVPVVRDVTPHIRELGPPLREVTQYAIALGKALADNPLLGLGAILGTAVAVEVGKAQLASKLNSSIIGPLGGLGIAIGLASAAVIAFEAFLNKTSQEGKAKAEEASDRAQKVRDKAKAELEQTGAISPATEKELTGLRDTEQRTLAMGDAIVKEGFTWGGFWDELVAADPTMFGPAQDRAKERVERDAALTGASASEKYRVGAGETEYLLAKNREATQEQKAAAAKLSEAADKLASAAGLNRSNQPTVPPVK